MTTYYVNNLIPSASNSNAGTDELQPWLTLAKAAAVLVAGDTVIVGAGGVYNERVTPAASGSISSRIVYTAAAGTIPKVRGFTVTNKSYITIQGLELTNSGFTADLFNAAIVATGSTGVHVISNYIHDTSAQAIRCNPNGATAKATFLVVRDNLMTNIGPAWPAGTGRAPIVEIWGDDCLVEGNDMSHGDDFLRPFGERNVYRNNFLHDSVETESPGGAGHIDGFQSFCSLNDNSEAANYMLVEGNIFLDNPGPNTHFGLINSTDTCGGSTTVIIRHNVIQNSGSFSYVADTNNGIADNHKYYNNTTVNASRNSHSTVDLSGTTQGAVLNNIFVDAIVETAPQKVYILDGSPTSEGRSNLAYMTANPSQTWANPINSEAGVILNQDPLFDSNLGLLAGSPAIGSSGPLTVVAAGDSGIGTTLILEDAHFFQPGWAAVLPDEIAIGSLSNHAAIVSIDYSTNTVELDTSLTRNSGDSVYLYANSSGTLMSLDRGAYPSSVTPSPIPVPTPTPTPGNGGSMINLVTLAQAKMHLNELGDDREDDIEDKIIQASDIIMDYLKLEEVPDEWVADSTASPVEYAIPGTVQSATLLVLAEIFENREASTSDPLTDAVVRLLYRKRDPALA